MIKAEKITWILFFSVIAIGFLVFIFTQGLAAGQEYSVKPMFDPAVVWNSTLDPLTDSELRWEESEYVKLSNEISSEGKATPEQLDRLRDSYIREFPHLVEHDKGFYSYRFMCIDNVTYILIHVKRGGKNHVMRHTDMSGHTIICKY